MNFPDNLKYTKDHEWVLVDGDVATIGVTDFAQSELGDIVFVFASVLVFILMLLTFMTDLVSVLLFVAVSSFAAVVVFAILFILLI